jgi:cellulose synthase (UDP-forming)
MSIFGVSSGQESAQKPFPIEDERLFEPLLRGTGRYGYLGVAVMWGLAGLWFWPWWLDPAKVLDPLWHMLITLVLVWLYLVPVYFIVIAGQARRWAKPLHLPADTRIAMVVTKAPSEDFLVVAATLRAMIAQKLPGGLTHDTWLADEDPCAQTLRWCETHGVKVSTRKGNADYHRATWPRRTRCKEGNLAYFYDHYGYDGYDFVSQLDADHVPAPGYLEEMLKPFAHPSVGYVSAPSICDSNAATSWSARARLNVEDVIFGALHAGYNARYAPMCIGSHYAVRTRALREIGGLGPELAEDFSTTMMMNAAGWRGVHAVDAIAHGEGPNNFADFVTQEFQWSRSLTTILLQWFPSHAAGLPWRIKLQFTFSLLWYPLFALAMLASYLLPIIALLRGRPFADVSYLGFLVHTVPVGLAMLLLVARVKASRGMSFLNTPRVLSWEGALYQLVRWPWIPLGVGMAIWDTLTGRFVDFRVTPKGRDPGSALPWRVLAPYAALVLCAALPVLLVSDAGDARGFYVLSLINAATYAVSLAVIIIVHARENGLDVLSTRTGNFSRVAAAGAVTVLACLGGARNGGEGLMVIAEVRAGPVRIIDKHYGVAGAGMGVRVAMVRFNPRVDWENWR